MLTPRSGGGRGVLLLGLCTAAVLAACGGDSTGPGDLHHQPPPGDTTATDTTPPSDTGSSHDTATVSAAIVNSMADSLYARLAQGADVTPDIAALLGSLAPVLHAGDTASLSTRLAAGQPVVLDFQATLVAQAYHANTGYGLDNFFAAMADAGVTAQDPAGPLTRDYLTAKLAPLVSQQAYTAHDIVPAIVLALGHARARRSTAGVTDDVWGDDHLDPLQAMLLMYAFDFSASDGAAARTVANRQQSLHARRLAVSAQSVSELPSFGDGAAFDDASLIAPLVNTSVDPADAPSLGVCDEVLLDGYQFDVLLSALNVWHRDAAHPDHPSASDVTATVGYYYTPSSAERLSLTMLGCQIPTPGPIVGKTVFWTSDDPLPEHGALSAAQSTTDASGNAVVTFQAVDESVPAGLQLREAPTTSGTITAQLPTINPRFPLLALVEGHAVYDTLLTTAVLTVHHYAFPDTLQLHVETSLASNDPSDVWNGTAHLDMPLVLNPPGAPFLYSGAGPAILDSYTNSTAESAGCSVSTPNGLLAGSVFPDTGSVQEPLVMVTQPEQQADAPSETWTCGALPPQTFGVDLLWSTWTLLHQPTSPGQMPLSGWTTVSPGVLELQFDGTFVVPDSDPAQTIDEQTTVTLRVPNA